MGLGRPGCPPLEGHVLVAPSPRQTPAEAWGALGAQQSPFAKQPEPSRCRTFLVSIFAFDYTPPGFFGERSLSGRRRHRKSINWWVRRRKGWSARHRMRWRSQRAGKTGWKFSLLNPAPSRDPCKGLGYPVGGGSFPGPLTKSHRSYKETGEMLIKPCSGETEAKAKTEEEETLELQLLTDTTSSVAQNHGQEISVALRASKGSPALFCVRSALIFAQNWGFFSDKMRAGLLRCI